MPTSSLLVALGSALDVCAVADVLVLEGLPLTLNGRFFNGHLEKPDFSKQNPCNINALQA